MTDAPEIVQNTAAQALESIKDRPYSGRHPELGPMINCQFCGFRHRENQNGRSNAEPCQQKFVKTKQGVEQIAGQTEATKPDNTVEIEIPRKQQRIIFGANRVKGRRKNPRHKPQKPLSHWQRILLSKAKHEKDNKPNA